MNSPVLFSGSRSGGWRRSGGGGRRRQPKGWSRSCSEVALPEATVSPGSGGWGRAWAPASPWSWGWADIGPGCPGCSLVDCRPEPCSSVRPDTVEFGEVALQPPELTAKPRTSGSGGQVSGAGGSPRAQMQRRVLTGPRPLHRAQGSVTSPPPNLCLSLHLCSSARKETADAEDAFKLRRGVPASGPLAGPTADCPGGEGAGRAGLQGAEEAAAAAAAGDPVPTATPPQAREEAADACVMATQQSACPWARVSRRVACG